MYFEGRTVFHVMCDCRYAFQYVRKNESANATDWHGKCVNSFEVQIGEHYDKRTWECTKAYTKRYQKIKAHKGVS